MITFGKSRHSARFAGTSGTWVPLEITRNIILALANERDYISAPNKIPISFPSQKFIFLSPDHFAHLHANFPLFDPLTKIWVPVSRAHSPSLTSLEHHWCLQNDSWQRGTGVCGNTIVLSGLSQSPYKSQIYFQRSIMQEACVGCSRCKWPTGNGEQLHWQGI